jgi:excisionase family DNA binding protein
MVGIMRSNEEPSPSPRFLTIEDVAESWRRAKAQIYALLRSGDLKGIQIGGRSQWRIERVKLEEYSSRRPTGALVTPSPIYPLT